MLLNVHRVWDKILNIKPYDKLLVTWELPMHEYKSKSMIICEKKSDFQKRIVQLKRSLRTNVGQFTETMAHRCQYHLVW
jgi:hypothetical protein